MSLQKMKKIKFLKIGLKPLAPQLKEVSMKKIKIRLFFHKAYM
jgi:hypothetical protein